MARPLQRQQQARVRRLTGQCQQATHHPGHTHHAAQQQAAHRGVGRHRQAIDRGQPRQQRPQHQQQRCRPARQGRHLHPAQPLERLRRGQRLHLAGGQPATGQRRQHTQRPERGHRRPRPVQLRSHTGKEAAAQVTRQPAQRQAGQRQPQGHAHAGTHHAGQPGLGQHPGAALAGRQAQHPQQGKLRHALRDRQRNHRKHQKRPHKQRHQRQHREVDAVGA